LKKGFFIVFEGADGSGKSTQAKLLFNKLSDDGYSCVITSEPGGTNLGKRIRRLLLDPKLKLIPKTELFLFLADRAEHVEEVIQPALSEGKIVICSRYFYSTLIYQGIARQIAGLDFLKKLNLFAVNNVFPDIVFYLDVNPENGLTKAKDISNTESYQGGDRIEREGIVLQQKVREGYLKMAEKYKDLFVVIEDGKDIDEINRNIYYHTKRRLMNDRTGENK